MQLWLEERLEDDVLTQRMFDKIQIFVSHVSTNLPKLSLAYLPSQPNMTLAQKSSSRGEAEHTGLKSKKIPNRLTANTAIANVGRLEFFRQERRETERAELAFKYSRSQPTASGVGEVDRYPPHTH
eukprot:m.747056 g.747056  ORF g.747056 m.747056 type:complete len:126 (+) comp23143_c0_seq2:1485-1862(+)